MLHNCYTYIYILLSAFLPDLTNYQPRFVLFFSQGPPLSKGHFWRCLEKQLTVPWVDIAAKIVVLWLMILKHSNLDIYF